MNKYGVDEALINKIEYWTLKINASQYKTITQKQVDSLNNLLRLKNQNNRQIDTNNPSLFELLWAFERIGLLDYFDNYIELTDYKKHNPAYNNTKTILLIILLVISTLILFFFDNGLYFIYNKIYPEDIIDYSNKNNIGLIVYIFLIIVCLYLFELFKKYLDKSNDKDNKPFYVGFRDWGDFPGFSFIKGWDIKQPIVQFFTFLLKITILFCSSPFISILITSLYRLMNFFTIVT
jgi:hypothetical protein